MPKPVELFSASYKPDYRLLAKHEEAEYCQYTEREDRIVPETIELPPLLRQFVANETSNPNPRAKIYWQFDHNNIYRLPKEGEKPNIEITMGLGKPVSPNLYKGLESE